MKTHTRRLASFWTRIFLVVPSAIVLATSTLLAAPGRAAEAHGNGHLHPASPGFWEAPLLFASLLGAGWLYANGAPAYRQSSRVRRTLRPLAFYSALLVLALALVGPLDVRSGERLTAHMVQHLALIGVAAPLLVVSRPVPRFVRTVPALRLPFAASQRLKIARGTMRFVGWMPVAVLIHVVTVFAWHAPPLYDAALSSDALHVVEHTMFFGTAILFWSAVLGGRTSSVQGGGAVFALFGAALAGNALGALLVFAEGPWYTTYASGPGSSSALLDQRLAGGLMWMVGGLFYLLAAVGVLVGWLSALERRSSRLDRAASTRIAGASYER